VNAQVPFQDSAIIIAGWSGDKTAGDDGRVRDFILERARRKVWSADNLLDPKIHRPFGI